jgi:hypothetical protein
LPDLADWIDRRVTGKKENDIGRLAWISVLGSFLNEQIALHLPLPLQPHVSFYPTPCIQFVYTSCLVLSSSLSHRSSSPSSLHPPKLQATFSCPALGVSLLLPFLFPLFFSLCLLVCIAVNGILPSPSPMTGHP